MQPHVWMQADCPHVLQPAQYAAYRVCCAAQCSFTFASHGPSPELIRKIALW